MITSGIFFKNFKIKKKNLGLKKKFKDLIQNNDQVIKSLNKNYKDFFEKKSLKKYKNFNDLRLIGMGGSSLGTQAIYSFLKHKVKKKFVFIDDLSSQPKINQSKKNLNLIVSKSGNTIETIVNSNILIKKNHKNIFITENKNNYLKKIAEKIKCEIIEHKNYIGGRYSVLSEVGMLPAELMGLNEKKFKQFNYLINNKNFINNLIKNVEGILQCIKKRKTNSVILNYDEDSQSLFYWYQQLVAESLGKKSKGILPIISSMPKDNHSLMQLYLDGFKNNFYTFFFVNQSYSSIINNNKLLETHYYLKNKNLKKIKYSQFLATKKIFEKKKSLLGLSL